MSKTLAAVLPGQGCKMGSNVLAFILFYHISLTVVVVSTKLWSNIYVAKKMFRTLISVQPAQGQDEPLLSVRCISSQPGGLS